MWPGTPGAQGGAVVAKRIARQIATVRAEMEKRPKGLIAHVERVLAEAQDLGRRWDLDPGRVELAVWGHDLFRSYRPGEQLRLAREAGVPIAEVDEASPVMLHGPIAAVVLREVFGVRDDEALEAVRSHTVGMAKMPLLAKVILLADKVEPRKRKRTPIMAEVRRLARRDLDLALLCWADWKWVDERKRQWLCHPDHWEARGEWVREHHLEREMPSRIDEAAWDAEQAIETAAVRGS
jgi:predicted HD superfamily hydrolase involved in NAD metabolism